MMAKRIPREALDYLNRLLKKLKLSLNEDKSKIAKAEEESFDFLGHTISFSEDLFGRKHKKHWNIEPSKKSQRRLGKDRKPPQEQWA
ncbi:MAG: hypothetical protein HS132_11740 [Planctomycetia bacterium]|nr:hypothetical protein [Planctomycetia bacterium]